MGRPVTKWDEKHIEGIVEFMSRGFSAYAYAGEIGVANSTVTTEWARTYPEFQAAIERGRAARLHYWEKRNIEIAEGKDGNVVATIFALKQLGWSDHLTVAGDPDKPLQLVADDLSLARTIAFLLNRATQPAQPAPAQIEGVVNGRGTDSGDAA